MSIPSSCSSPVKLRVDFYSDLYTVLGWESLVKGALGSIVVIWPKGTKATSAQGPAATPPISGPSKPWGTPFDLHHSASAAATMRKGS